MLLIRENKVENNDRRQVWLCQKCPVLSGDPVVHLMHASLWAPSNPVPCGPLPSPQHKWHFDRFSHFSIAHTRDQQTDRQTDRQTDIQSDKLYYNGNNRLHLMLCIAM